MSKAELGGAVPLTAAYSDLERKFRPIFEKIGEGAVAREAERRLPYEEIGWHGVWWRCRGRRDALSVIGT
jgi:hypothetical protein